MWLGTGAGLGHKCRRTGRQAVAASDASDVSASEMAGEEKSNFDHNNSAFVWRLASRFSRQIDWGKSQEALLGRLSRLERVVSSTT